MSTRKGVTRPDDVPAEILTQLNSGRLETVTLAESLAIDFVVLMSHTVPKLADEAAMQIKSSDGITKRMTVAGELLLDKLGTHIPQVSGRVRGIFKE